MADESTDSTRELIAGAEEMLEKRKKGADERVDEEQSLRQQKGPEATEELIASSENLIRKGEESSGLTWLLWVVLAAIAGAAAVFLLT